jgi:hypothetical protein
MLPGMPVTDNLVHRNSFRNSVNARDIHGFSTIGKSFVTSWQIKRTPLPLRPENTYLQKQVSR